MMLEDALRDELDRVRIVREDYLSMPLNAGQLGATILTGYLAQGRRALEGGDEVAMTAALEDLRGCE